MKDPVKPLSQLPGQIRALVSERHRAAVERVRCAANPYASRHQTGLATCWLDSGRRLQVFWKLGPTQSREDVGRLGGTGYELEAYRAIERIGAAPAPRLIGGARMGSRTLLVTTYVEDALRVHKSPVPLALECAAARIGQFHSRPRTATPGRRLDRYTAETFAAWAERACHAVPEALWLSDVARAFPHRAVALQATALTVVHGEFYPDNILASAAGTTAVDWEWAGVGMGEIDLAALTEGTWDPRTIARCTSAYAESRGLGSGNRLLAQRLAASRLYLHLRWLGARSRPRETGPTRWRLRQARALAVGLGLIATGRPS